MEDGYEGIDKRRKGSDVATGDEKREKSFSVFAGRFFLYNKVDA